MGGLFGSGGLLGGPMQLLFGKPEKPAAPDYTGAAQATAQGNLQLAQQNAEANRVSQYTPWGNLVYNRVHGDPNNWQATVTLSPDQQKLLDAQNQSALQMSGMFGMLGNQAHQNLNTPFDTSMLPAQQVNPGQTAQDAIMSRIQPMLDKRQEALRTQLANQGITSGSEAYTGSMDEFNRQANDAYIQAALQGINVGENARKNALTEAAFLRNEPLNELNALRTGNQVTAPNFINTPQQQYTPGADLLGAANLTGQFNTDLANMNNAYNSSMMNGLFSLGSAGLAKFSDRRLKSNIVKVGNYNGHNIYEYDIFGKRERGVMAQEVMSVKPDAVLVSNDGWLMVDYSKL